MLSASGTVQGLPSSKKNGPASCRTCTYCRRKKVKCDGQRPACMTCVLREETCEYPQDARRTALRTKKEHVIALQQQVQRLERELRSRSIHVETAIDKEDEKEPHPRVSPATVEPAKSWSHESTSDQSPTPLASQESSDTDSQFYGATSLLRDRSSVLPLAASPEDCTRPLSIDRSTRQMFRDALVSYSAIQRQQEATLRSGPSITSKIDFDQLDADTALHLLDLHWNRQHLSYLLTYRPAIVDNLFRGGGPYVNKLLLNAIYFQSSRYSDRLSLRTNPRDPQTHGEAFLTRFNALLGQHIGEATIPTIVALLTCGACLVPHGQQSTGWIYCGIAYRMITDLGLHLDGGADASTPKSDIIDGEIRKRVYWAAYVGDKLQSLFLGRAPEILKSRGTVSREYLDVHEEMEEWTPHVDETSTSPAYKGQPCYALSTFRRLLELCDIAESIIDGLYSVGSARGPRQALLDKRDEMRLLLRQWAQTTPPWLEYEPGVDPTPPPHQITPHAMHCTLVILTEQALLGSGHPKVEQDDASLVQSRKICIDAAVRIWRLLEAYKTTFTLRRAQYGIAYAAYCATLVILQQADEDSDQYLCCIKFFWDALWEFQRGCNRGLKRPLRLLRSLMARMERVAQALSLEKEDELLPEDWPDMSTFQANLEFMLLDGSTDGLEPDSLMGDPLRPLKIDGVWLSDSMFGIANDSMQGNYM